MPKALPASSGRKAAKTTKHGEGAPLRSAPFDDQGASAPFDRAAAYRALVTHDARFDGVFFVGVRTTGIYCRPVCRARTPREDRCVFFRRAAEAERDGFRACFRCRPERAPGSGSDSFVSRTVARAVARIEEGALNDGSVNDLARELGVTPRHLRRCVQSELGVSPVELALSRRLALSRELVHGTTLPMTDIAFASGFRSLRRFNDAFRTVHGRAPLEMRRGVKERGGGHPTHAPSPRPEGVRLTLDYRAPYDWASIVAFLAARAVRGVEAVENDAYMRAVRISDRRGWIAVRPARANGLSLEVAPSLAPHVMAVVARVRRLFDLDARPDAIDRHLTTDARLAPLVEARPGLRVPGAFEPFEAAALAVLGQQVTVRAAVTLATRLVEALGEDVVTPFSGVRRLWPTRERMAQSREETLAKLGIPVVRARALLLLAKAASNGWLEPLAPASAGELGDRWASPSGDLETLLLAIPGIGPWTAQYILMRATGWPDAFPVHDAGLAAALGISRTRVTTDIAAAWRPWRSYATIHLWTHLAGDRS